MEDNDSDLEIQAATAAEFIAQFLLKWGRVPVRDYKEKYGTVRVYCSLGWNYIHQMAYPGHAYSRFPRWLWLFDLKYGHIIFYYSGLGLLSFHYHKFLYRLAYKIAVKKFPKIKREILMTADWPEYLKDL